MASTRSATCCSRSSTRCGCCSPRPTSSCRKRNPDRFLRRAAEVIRQGWGQPSVFNADLVVEELLRQGKSIEDARAGGTSGCVETGAFGKEAYILTGYFNLVKVLEITLNGGVDPRDRQADRRRHGRRRRRSGASTSCTPRSSAQLAHFLDIKIRANRVIERIYATWMPAPFLSLLIDDCVDERHRLQRGRRALQHHLHHARRHRDGDRRAVRAPAARVRRRRGGHA